MDRMTMISPAYGVKFLAHKSQPVSRQIFMGTEVEKYADTIQDAIDRLADYEDIGPVGECAAAADKQQYKLLTISTYGRTETSVQTDYICPTCGCVWEDGPPKTAYCGACGQRIKE